MTARITNWFRHIANWTLPKFGLAKKSPAPVSEEERLTRSLGRYEPYVFQLQSILIWENPILSALYFLAVNFIFWFIVNYECRFYGVFFSAVLVFSLYEMWIEHVWPEISIPTPKKPETEEWTPQHPTGVLSVPEISGYVIEMGNLIKAYFIYLKTLRAEHPGIFCCEMCGVFGALLLISRSFSGVTIAYCLLMSLLLGPGIVLHLLPPCTLTRVATVLASFKHQDVREDMELEDNLLPDVNVEDMELLHLAGDVDDSSDKDDAHEFSLDPALDADLTASLPDSFLDDLDDFAPSAPPPPRGRHGTPSDSDDSSGTGIHFRSSHFNGTSSSSEEEEAFSRGLAFVDTPIDQAQAEQAGSTLMGGLAQNLTTLGTSLLTSVMSRAAPPRPPRAPSSDSDEFEIIDSEDALS